MSDFPQLQNPVQTFQQSYQFGAGIRQMQAQAEQAAYERDQARLKQEAADRAAAEAEKRQADIAAYGEKIRNGTVTTQDHLAAALFLGKDQAAAIGENLKRMDSEKRQTSLKEMGEMYAALSGGHANIADSMFDTQIKALENSDQKDEAAQLSAIREVAKTNPVAAAGYFGTMLGIMGDDGVKVLDNALKLTRGPGGETKAYTDIASTEQQIAESKARTNKLAAELKALETASGGKIPPDKMAAAEDDLRKELITQTKSYSLITDAYGRMAGASATGAGDLAIVFGYMKILDPTSVVREGEQASAANAAGVPSAVRAAYNKVVGGGLLDEKSRREMLAEAKRISDKAAAQEKQAEAKILDIGKRRGLDLKNIAPKPAAQETVKVDY